MRFCNKKHIALLAVALVCLGAIPRQDGALPRASFHATPKSALDVAEQESSLVLLVFGAPSCSPCNQLKTNTLASSEFLTNAGALRIAEVDVEADPQTARKFNVRNLPMLILMTPDRKVLASTIGAASTSELLAWIRDGRQRLAHGLWEGVAPSFSDSPVSLEKEESLDEEGVKRLILLLGKPDPAERAIAAKQVLAQRESAMAPLIEAATDSALGIRIAVSELLLKLAPDAPSFDPWQPPSELSDEIAQLKQWWAATGRLPMLVTARRMDPSTESSIKSSLEMLAGDDPLQRTEAMSALVRHGEAALPSIREAIKNAAKNSEGLRILPLLEDVRWAILIPDAVEKRVSGARTALARGNATEKQTAAVRLGRLGREVIPALAELVNDSDTLLVESAVRSLSNIGGRDSIPAMAALLNAKDTNIRMTAAQALGRTKTIEALKPLLSVVDDPDEVVACVALAAVEQIHAGRKYSSNKKELAPDLLEALKRSLADTRWRVRAAAAEVIGKLGVHQLMAELQAALNDSDSFVVKSALLALQQIGATPDGDRLLVLAKRLPSLRADAIALMMQAETPDTAKTVTEMYHSSDPDVQLGILSALQKNTFTSNDRKKADVWKPLLKQASTASDARIRRAVAQVLSRRPPETSAELLGSLLSDEDHATRVNAAEALLYVLAGESKFDYDTGNFLLQGDQSPSVTTNTNSVSITPAQIKSWNTAVLQRRLTPDDPVVDLAAYLTGDAKSGLPLLLSALDQLETGKTRRIASLPVFGPLLQKLPWPEGKQAVDILRTSPLLFSLCAVQWADARPEVAGEFLHATNFCRVIERATGPEMMEVLQVLMGVRRPTSSLLVMGSPAIAIAHALSASTNGACRAAGIYIVGRQDAENNVSTLERSLVDINPWVRIAAIQGLSMGIKDRVQLEKHLHGLLADTNKHVQRIAAAALLEPEIREAAGLKWQFSGFTYEELRGANERYFDSSDERPLTAIEQKPAFLESVRAQVGTAGLEEAGPLAVLLAQYGDGTGVDRLIALQQSAGDDKNAELSDEILTCIALLRDARHASFLRQFMDATQEDFELRKVLRALKGMSGTEARQLRLDVNKKLRKTTE